MLGLSYEPYILRLAGCICRAAPQSASHNMPSDILSRSRMAWVRVYAQDQPGGARAMEYVAVK